MQFFLYNKLSHQDVTGALNELLNVCIVAWNCNGLMTEKCSNSEFTDMLEKHDIILSTET